MFQRKKIGLINYDGGNISSITGALQRAGYNVKLLDEFTKERDFCALIIPGVGNMDYAMKMINKKKLSKLIIDVKNENAIPLIGICLGAQIFFEKSEEENSKGLGLISGSIKSLPYDKFHIGWNKTWATNNSFNFGEANFYFNHQYYIECDKNIILQKAFFEVEIPVIIKDNNIWGLQFHPEKSQLMGLQLLKKILGNS